jgi:hypothetical protein
MAKWTETNQLEFAGFDAGTGSKVVAFEVQASRSVGGEAAELAFVVEGTADETQARTIAEAAIIEWDALAFDGKPLVAIALKPEYTDEDNGDPATGRGYGRWHVRATYSRRAFAAPALLNETQQLVPQAIELDISGERRHITQGIATLWKCVPSGRTQIDFGGAIRVKKNGKNTTVEGTDIVLPRRSFTVPKTVPTKLLTPLILDKLESLVGQVNAAPFTITLNEHQFNYGWGELRFMGVSGRLVEGADRSDLVFRFESSKTKFDAKIAAGTPYEIRVPMCRGFDLLWVSYEEKDAEGCMTLRPRQANVEAVCDDGDFSVLRTLGVK